MQRMERLVTIKAATKVVPTFHGTHAAKYELSNIDQMFSSPVHYPQLVFFFKSCAHFAYSPSREIVGLIDSLKGSLAMALDVYPMVAGRVRSGRQGRLEVVREPGDGVLFLEATADARLEDWPDLRRCVLLPVLNPQAENGEVGAREWTEHTPLAKVQVTAFNCGGLALGFSFAHILTDGMGAISFLKEWGEIHQCQAKSPVSPFLPRTVLIKARNPPQPTVLIPDTTTSFFFPPRHFVIKRTLPVNGKAAADSSSLPHVISVRVSDKKVSDCVREVERGPYGYGRATSHEALVALLWCCLTRSRGWSSDDEKSRFSFPVNIRSRCDPPIPETYFGNAMIQTCSVAKASDIAKLHISYAAKLIHEAIKSHSAEFCQSVIDWMELQITNEEDNKAIRIGANFGDPETFGCTTFAGFPLYDVNFGWGKPLYVSFIQMKPVSQPHFTCGALIMPSPEGGRSRDLTIGCANKKQMDALLDDPILQLYLDEKDILSH